MGSRASAMANVMIIFIVTGKTPALRTARRARLAGIIDRINRIDRN
jgi:hypothetical protein